MTGFYNRNWNIIQTMLTDQSINKFFLTIKSTCHHVILKRLSVSLTFHCPMLFSHIWLVESRSAWQELRHCCLLQHTRL